MNLLRISQYLKRFVYVYLTTFPGNYQTRKNAILIRMILEGAKFMNELGEDYWLDFGSLLGYFREGSVIPHDIDVDFAMEAKFYQQVLNSQHRIPKGFSFYDSSHRHHGPKVYLSYKGFDIDIYFYQDNGNSIQSTENTKFSSERQDIPKSLIFPLKTISMMGQEIKIPNETKKYLETIYGYIGRNAVRDLKTGFWREK